MRFDLEHLRGGGWGGFVYIFYVYIFFGTSIGSHFMLPDFDITMMVIYMAQLFSYGSSLIQSSTEEDVILSV